MENVWQLLKRILNQHPGHVYGYFQNLVQQLTLKNYRVNAKSILGLLSIQCLR